MMERLKLKVSLIRQEEDKSDLTDFQLSSSLEPAVIRQRNNSDNVLQGTSSLSSYL